MRLTLATLRTPPAASLHQDPGAARRSRIRAGRVRDLLSSEELD